MEVLRDWGWGWGGAGKSAEGRGHAQGRIPGVSRCTALAACEHFLAAGTPQGHLIWFNRKTHKVETLHTQQYSPITFVKIVSTVDYMVAAGNRNGTVTIFQIPKVLPDSLPKSLKVKEDRPIERFTVGDLHRSEITYIEWSKNGMKLFSGDKNGLVVMTEIDFYMHICKSSEIINEAYEIVQISYLRDDLLVSSVFRSIICHKKNNKWDVTQVGKKERKNLIKLGGVFHFDYDKPNDVNIYCGRPGFRLWTSDGEGNVLKTLLFKDAIADPVTRVELLKPHKKIQKSAKELNFGHIHIFNEKYLLTYNEDQLYILNPENLIAIAVVDNLKRISVVSVNKDEIFVLDDEADIIRIAYQPDFQVESSDPNLMTKSLTNPLQFAVNTIKGIAETESQVTFSDMADSCDSFLSSIMSHDKHYRANECNKLITAEECFEDSFELPPIKELPLEIDTNMLDKIMHKYITDEQNLANSQPPIYPQKIPEVISDPVCEEILCAKASQSIRKAKNANIINFDENNIQKNNNEQVKLENKKNHFSEKVLKSATSPNNKTSNASYVNDDPSPDTLEKEILDKEKLLAQMLDLEPITVSSLKIDDEKLDDRSITFEEKNVYSEPNEPVAAKSKTSNNTLNRLKTSTDHSSSITMSPPKCVTLPEQWNIQNIELKVNVDSPTHSMNGFVFKPKERLPSSEESNDWVFL